jgi:hypothetical protein
MELPGCLSRHESVCRPKYIQGGIVSDYRYQLVKHNGIDCLHVMTEIEPVNDGITHAYIPLDDILESAIAQGYITGEAEPKKEEHDK